MSIPSLPTIDEIVAEGLAKAGNSNPSSAKTSRAKNKWMEEIKNDISRIAKRTRWLQITSHGILAVGQARYSNPTDFGHDLSLVLLDGDVRGTASSAGSGSLTLEAGTFLNSGDVTGKDILITSGTGQASLSQCTAYDPTTLVATVTPNFTVAPGSGSTYLIVTQEHPVLPGHVGEVDRGRILVKNRPTTFSQIGDEDYGEFVFNSAPDKAYGARLRYYADIGRLDLAGTHIQTLYYKWRNLWLMGIRWKEYAENDDSNSMEAKSDYKAELGILRADQYGMDLNQMQATVMDFHG